MMQKSIYLKIMPKKFFKGGEITMLEDRIITVLIKGTADSIDTSSSCDFELELIDSNYEKHNISFGRSCLTSIKHTIDGYIELIYEFKNAIGANVEVCKINLLDEEFSGITNLSIYQLRVKIGLTGRWYPLRNRKLPETKVNNELISGRNEYQEILDKVEETKETILERLAQIKICFK